MQHSVGIDIRNAPCHRLCFGQSYSRSQRLQLTVQVGQRHGIAVYQRQLADPSPRQTLRRIAAHSAKAEYDHMGLRQTHLGFRPPQHLIA